MVDASGNPLLDASGTPLTVGAADNSNCDPDTGVCAASSGDPTSPAAASANSATGPVIATTLDQSSDTGKLALMILIVLLILGLVLVPALAWRHFSSPQQAGHLTGTGSA